MNAANLITVLRFPLLVVVVLLLYFGGTAGQLIDAFLIVVLILMDSLDGIVARRRHEQTLIGSALDIAADRAVEIVLWVTYTHLGLIPVVIPLTVIIRGALTDSIRNIALQYGKSAHSMMQSSWGRWLVASSPMRTGYAVVKAVAFTLLALALGLKSGGHAAWHGVWIVGSVFSWVSLVMCVLRGLPVIIEAPALFQSSEFQVTAPSAPRERANEQ
jgi:CDP-diacylglycerol--glycerol-3-phosphate 3-phosphatidyltransferase